MLQILNPFCQKQVEIFTERILRFDVEIECKRGIFQIIGVDFSTAVSCQFLIQGITIDVKVRRIQHGSLAIIGHKLLFHLMEIGVQLTADITDILQPTHRVFTQKLHHGHTLFHHLGGGQIRHNMQFIYLFYR